jgi:hypothetical protein
LVRQVDIGPTLPVSCGEVTTAFPKGARLDPSQVAHFKIWAIVNTNHCGQSGTPAVRSRDVINSLSSALAKGKFLIIEVRKSSW